DHSPDHITPRVAPHQGGSFDGVSTHRCKIDSAAYNIAKRDQMPERMLPFTYRRKLGRGAYVRRVEKLFELRRTAQSVRTQRYPCTVPALRKFAAQVLPKDLYAYV